MKSFQPATVALVMMFMVSCADEPKDMVELESPGPESGHVTVLMSRAKLEARENSVWLVLPAAQKEIEILWAVPPHLAPPVELKDGVQYTFTVESTLLFPASNYMHSRVIKVTQNGRVIFDRAICEVHLTRMVRKQVPILYGFIVPGPNEASHDEASQSFPHASEVALGGCVSGSDSPKTAAAYVCGDCKAAHRFWKLKQGLRQKAKELFGPT